MVVMFECRSPCQLCGYLIRVVMTSTVRVNRRSVRTAGVSLGAWMYRACPECGTPVACGSAAPRTPYVLLPDSAAEVAAYRLRKFGVTDKGAPRERVAG